MISFKFNNKELYSKKLIDLIKDEIQFLRTLIAAQRQINIDDIKIYINGQELECAKIN